MNLPTENFIDKKVMVVDDDTAILEAIKLILEDEGYSVITSSDYNVLEVIKNEKPGLLLLDLWLSGRNGKDVIEEIKTVPDLLSMPILLVSASRDMERAAEESGADGYIAKPFDIDELIDCVKRFV